LAIPNIGNNLTGQGQAVYGYGAVWFACDVGVHTPRIGRG
jgi:hypothetical protein